MSDDTCILVVDDEVLIAMSLTVTLEEIGLRVCGRAATAAKAVELACKHRPKIVLMDVRLKGEADGVDAALEIHRLTGSQVIFITGSREPETLERINQDHPAAILFKPILPIHLTTAVEKVLGRGGKPQ
jgi:DNA-binding NarL/FixJ family response regulator